MELTRETVARMAREVAGLKLANEDLDRVLPYVRAQLANVAKLEALATTLGLQTDDPRAYTYAEDHRWLETAPPAPQSWGEQEVGR